MSLLEAYNTIYKYDISCISEIYSDPFVSVDDTTLSLPGYNLVRPDHPSNIKRAGVCLYYKIYLWNQLLYHFFPSVCYAKWPFKVKKVMSLLSIHLQVNQQLNLMSFYQILRIYLILLKDSNHPLLLHWFFNNNVWVASVNIRPNSSDQTLILHWSHLYWST